MYSTLIKVRVNWRQLQHSAAAADRICVIIYKRIRGMKKKEQPSRRNITALANTHTHTDTLFRFYFGEWWWTFLCYSSAASSNKKLHFTVPHSGARGSAWSFTFGRARVNHASRALIYDAKKSREQENDLLHVYTLRTTQLSSAQLSCPFGKITRHSLVSFRESVCNLFFFFKMRFRREKAVLVRSSIPFHASFLLLLQWYVVVWTRNVALKM